MAVSWWCRRSWFYRLSDWVVLWRLHSSATVGCGQSLYLSFRDRRPWPSRTYSRGSKRQSLGSTDSCNLGKSRRSVLWTS